jgi:hypothetical protein
MSYLPRGVARCQHVKVNGTRCESPALKGKAYCYFHYRSRLSGAAVLPKANSRQLTANSQELNANRQDLSPAGVPLNTEFLLLEDANSIQCALQWVLRRILDASIDRRQAALLLYGLQIAASNVKQTTFEPYYRNVIRNLPATETAMAAANASSEVSAAVPAAVAADVPPVANPDECALSELEMAAPARAGHPRDSRQDAGATFPATSSDSLPNAPPLATASPDFPQPPTASRPKRPTRRKRASSAVLDHRMLSSSPRAALSLMFQREVKRHLARLDFPNSPETDAVEN